MTHQNYPPFFGPYGCSLLECEACGLRIIEDANLWTPETTKDPQIIELMTRMIILKSEHYVEHYTEYPYDQIRMSYNKRLSLQENVDTILREWPQYNDQCSQIEHLVESYSNYVYEDDGALEKATSEILVDQLNRLV